MLRPVIRGRNRLIGGSWFFRLRLHSLALPCPHQRSCRDAIYGLPPLLLSFTVCMFVNTKG